MSTEILTKIREHEEAAQRLNDELLAERDATQAKIEQLQSYRFELDEFIRRRGLRSEESRQERIPTNRTGVVKRSPREKADYIASVPVDRIGSMKEVILAICSDGLVRTKDEIFEAVAKVRPDTKRSSFDMMIGKLGFDSKPNTRPFARSGSRLYWLNPTT